MAERRQTDPFALAAFVVSLAGLVISLIGAVIAFVHFIDYSEVEVLPLEQVVMVLDDRRPSRQQTLIVPEVSIFNRASGSYSDAIRNVYFTISTNDGARFCFEDMAYARLRIDGVALGNRLNQSAVASTTPVMNEVSPPGTAPHQPCEELECIRQGLGGEFLLVTLEGAIPQTLGAGSVHSGRIAFKPRACRSDGPIPTYQEMLDSMLGRVVTFQVEVETLKDGRHTTSCRVEITEREHTFAAREKFLSRSCQPLQNPPPSAVDRFRAWLDAQI